MSEKPPSIWQVIVSVSAALFGVQNDKNRQRDFQQGKAIHYIIAGIIGVILLIVILLTIVKLILS